MTPALGAALAVLTVLAILVAIHVPLGTWIHRVFTSEHDSRLERGIYRLVGVDARTEQRWLEEQYTSQAV